MTDRSLRPTVDEALAIIRDAVGPLGTETVATAEAFGRIAAAAVHARQDAPRFRSSAMDGFALSSAETENASAASPITLRLQEPIFAGASPPPLTPGTAVPISTGAPLPQGADTVLVRERAEAIAGALLVRAPVEPQRNVRQIGEDAVVGAEVLSQGAMVSPQAVGALIAYGVGSLDVRCLPRVGLISTGSELTGVDDPISGGALIDSNAPMIGACLQALRLPYTILGRAADRHDMLDLLLDGAGKCDLIISTGGVSAGELDLVRARLQERGADILFHGVRMRPGKPILFARLADGRPYFGLPGNPVAALVGFRFFVVDAIRRMLALQPEAGESVSLAENAREGTTMFLRACRTSGLDGNSVVDCELDQRSHTLRSTIGADCWVKVGEAGSPSPVIAYPFVASL